MEFCILSYNFSGYNVVTICSATIPKTPSGSLRIWQFCDWTILQGKKSFGTYLRPTIHIYKIIFFYYLVSYLCTTYFIIYMISQIWKKNPFWFCVISRFFWLLSNSIINFSFSWIFLRETDVLYSAYWARRFHVKNLFRMVMA